MFLATARLILRPIEESDASALFPLINDQEIVRYTLNIPHPYPEDALAQWIRGAREAMDRRERCELSMVLRETGLPIGVCSMFDFSREHMNAEVAYWLGRRHWGQGYTSEAVRRIVRFGFEDLHLERIHARVFAENARSIRVIEKAGLELERCARREVRKGDRFFDILHYGLIREEYSP